MPELNFIDDKSGKPIGINQHISRRPIMAFGNSDGGSEDSVLILEQALDPQDASETTEGLPAPVRAIVIARN